MSGATSSINYKRFAENPSDHVQVAYVPNTINNIGSSHFEITNKTTGKAFAIELYPFPAKFLNFNNEEDAAKFETDKLKRKFYLHLKQGVPPALNAVSEKRKEKIIDEQNKCLDLITAVDDMCIQAMWDNPAVLKKKKKELKKACDKNGMDAFELFKAQAHSGLAQTDEGDIDIKMKTNAYRRNKRDPAAGPLIHYPTLINSTTATPFDFTQDSTKVNRGAFIGAQMRIKPYITPSGSYGTTYIYESGVMWVNGPEYASAMDYTDYSDDFGLGEIAAEAAEAVGPPAKKQKKST